MSDRLVCFSSTDGEVGVTLGDNYRYFYTAVDLKVVFVTVSSNVNDADLTIDINDDGSGVIEAVSAAVKATPGTWKAKHMGGANDEISIAAGSLISLDANDAAVNSVAHVQIWALTGGGWS